MNRYGSRLMEMWKIAQPDYLLELEDAEAHFTQIGEQAMTEIIDLTDRLQGTDPEGESYLEKVARIQAARRTAEEIVLQPLMPPTDYSEPDVPEGWDSMSPTQMETWIKENVEPGERYDEMMQEAQQYREDLDLIVGAWNDPEVTWKNNE